MKRMNGLRLMVAAVAMGLATVNAGPRCKSVVIGKFEDGKGWEKAIPPTRAIWTQKQLDAFFKALGVKPDVTVDFTKNMLCVSTVSASNPNSFFHMYKIREGGDLKLMVGMTRKAYKKPEKGPYFTRISLVFLPTKGIKKFNGQTLPGKK